MKCPYCGSSFQGAPLYCPNCKQPLSRAPKTAKEPEKEVRKETPEVQAKKQKRIVGSVLVLCLLLLVFGVTKLADWIGDYRITRLYARGELTPTVHAVDLDDGRVGHSIVFYGNDGDRIFIPELQKSLMICGGVARITIPDSDWFDGDVTDVSGAKIILTPELLSEKGTVTQLPAMTLDIDVPDAPITVISPTSNGKTIVTSRYTLEMRFFPGSTVMINGEDVTGYMDRSGLLKQDVVVQPIGENVYTIIAQTNHHHESRKDITIYREAYEIDVELDTSVSNTSKNETMAITGRIEVGAKLTVETSHVEKSILLDENTGDFSFIANLSEYGNNIIRFRVTKEGKKDAVVSMNVDYTPTLAKYSAKAWKMDYKQLTTLYEQWTGHVFLCKGPIIDIVKDGDNTYYVMDVSTGDATGQYIMLLNLSSINAPTLGRVYSGYADVNGRHMYKSKYYPALNCRYLDLAN